LPLTTADRSRAIDKRVRFRTGDANGLSSRQQPLAMRLYLHDL
jgi:hypothetical protein